MQILSVTLDNDKSINSSFSSRLGDTFIVSDNGNAYMNFGKNKPSDSGGTGVYSGAPVICSQEFTRRILSLSL